MFGWNTEVTWKIADIKPSEAPGISQATVVFSAPKGQQVTKIYVTPDQKFAFTGDLVPFGTDPFAAARQELKAANGPSHGPPTQPSPLSSLAIWNVRPAKRRSPTSPS